MARWLAWDAVNILLWMSLNLQPFWYNGVITNGNQFIFFMHLHYYLTLDHSKYIRNKREVKEGLIYKTKLSAKAYKLTWDLNSRTRSISFRELYPVISQLNLALYCLFLRLLCIFPSIICMSPCSLLKKHFSTSLMEIITINCLELWSMWD